MLAATVALLTTPLRPASAQTVGGGEDNVPPSAAADTVYFAYLVPWEWKTTLTSTAGTETRVIEYHRWSIKYFDRAAGLIDMRTSAQSGCNPDQRICAVPGWAFAIFADNALPPDPEVFYLTYWQSGKSGRVASINNQDAGFILFGLPNGFTSDTLDGIIKESMVNFADPDGIVSAPPLLPNANKVIHADIGPIRLFTDRVSDGSIAWQKATARLQAEYERLRSIHGDQFARETAGWWEQKYGEDIRSAEQVSRDGATLKPGTTITDDFDCADSDTMGCDLTWTETDGDWDIASNQATKTANAEGTTRAESTLSGTDMYAQVDCNNLLSFNWCGVAVNFDSSADTAYLYIRQNDNTSHRIVENTAGTWSDLAGCGSDYLGGTSDVVLYLENDGGDLEAFEDAVSKCTATDTTLTNNQCGLAGYHTGPNYNDFICEDLGAAPTPRRVFITIE